MCIYVSIVSGNVPFSPPCSPVWSSLHVYLRLRQWQGPIPSLYSLCILPCVCGDISFLNRPLTENSVSVDGSVAVSTVAAAVSANRATLAAKLCIPRKWSAISIITVSVCDSREFVVRHTIREWIGCGCEDYDVAASNRLHHLRGPSPTKKDQ